MQVRRPEHLEGVDRLVVPGGESTTMSMLAERSGLLEPLRELVRGGAPGVRHLRRSDPAVVAASATAAPTSTASVRSTSSTRRNGFGRQVDSFTEPITITGLDGPAFRAVCIRAPVIERRRRRASRCWPGSTTTRRWCVQGAIMVSIFHPELADDTRVHELFLSH